MALQELASRGLLAAGRADRAGVWTESFGGQTAEEPAWEGVVVEAKSATVPQEWKFLSPSAPYFKAILQGESVKVPGLAEVSRVPLIPLLAGMRTVLWLPIRYRGRTLGLAMVASANSRGAANREVLQNLTDELGLAIAERRSSELLEKAQKQPDIDDLSSAVPGEQSQPELRCLLDALECGVLLLDGAGRIRHANVCLAQLFGLKTQRLVEIADFAGFVRAVKGHLRDRKAFVRPATELWKGEEAAAREELELVRPVRKALERQVRPVLDRSGHNQGWLELYRDITDQRLIQSKLLQTEKMAAIGQLVSGIAHELNNPLTGIMGYAQLLLGHGLSPSQLVDAQKIYHEAERARHIVKNLLLFARETQLQRTRVDLNELVERTLALRSYEMKVEDIAVALDLDPDLPQTGADPIQLQQVVLNLLVNSEHAILEARGHGHIWIRTRQIAGDRLMLEVADDGPGIAPEIASRIFDPFFTTKPPGLGTGLGLSIVYGIVQQHGGEIYVQSRPEGGTTFVVELPLVAVSAEEPAVKGTARLVAASEGRRILVVEDEPTVGQLIADVLREEQHEVDVVFESQEGLDRCARKPYDLVICDLRMPRLDGQAFYHALVAAGSPVQRRMIFITGDTLAPRTVEFLEKSGLPYLAKPFLVEELKLAVNRLLEAGRPEARIGEVGWSRNAQGKGSG